jgi:hypothetical protein
MLDKKKKNVAKVMGTTKITKEDVSEKDKSIMAAPKKKAAFDRMEEGIQIIEK